MELTHLLSLIMIKPSAPIQSAGTIRPGSSSSPSANGGCSLLYDNMTTLSYLVVGVAVCGAVGVVGRELFFLFSCSAFLLCTQTMYSL